MQKKKDLHLGQDCSPLGSGWNQVRDIKENNWVVRTPGWVILYWREEYTDWSHLQSVSLWRQEYCAPHFPLSPFPFLPSQTILQLLALSGTTYMIQPFYRKLEFCNSTRKEEQAKKTHKWPSRKGLLHYVFFTSVLECISSVTQSCLTLCNCMDRSMPALPFHCQLPEFTPTHVHWVSDAIQPSHPLSSPSPPTFSLSSIRVFSNELALCIRWPKYWSFTFNISASNEDSRLISFRMDWLDLLAVQGTLKNLLQHHSSKASVLQHSAFFIVQLSHLCITIGKIVALSRWTFVGKVMSLLFNMLSRLVITFLPRSKHLLISWLQSPSAEILEPKKE